MVLLEINDVAGWKDWESAVPDEEFESSLVPRRDWLKLHAHYARSPQIGRHRGGCSNTGPRHPILLPWVQDDAVRSRYDKELRSGVQIGRSMPNFSGKGSAPRKTGRACRKQPLSASWPLDFRGLPD